MLNFQYFLSNISLAYHFHYDDFLSLEHWRLFVDGDKQNITTEADGRGFENREPGYMQAMFKAFSFMRATAGMEISEEFIKNLHYFATYGVQFSSRAGKDIKKVDPGEYYSRQADFHSGFLLHLGKNASEAGIRDLLNAISEDSGLCMTLENPNSFGYTTINWNWIKTHGRDNAIKLLQNCYFPIRVCTQTNTQEEISLKLSTLVKNFNHHIKTAQEKDKKLIVILYFIRSLCRLHPFKDANIRVFVMLLFNKCLIENGFSPTILDNPNVFDGHSIEELVIATKKGFDNFRFVKTHHYWPAANVMPPKDQPQKPIEVSWLKAKL